jgi:uroporphyrinogen decarboxylase
LGIELGELDRLRGPQGERLLFFAGLSVTRTLPFGTPEEVRAEVRERVKVLGNGGGYICGPDHSIQKNMPAANLAALFDEARTLLGSS